MNIALITRRAAELASLKQSLETRLGPVNVFFEDWRFVESIRNQKWDLVLIDDLAFPFRHLAGQILESDASIHMAAITEREAKAFHDEAEGLGMLCSLGAQPGADDIENLLVCLRNVGALLPETEAAQARLGATRDELHEYCVVCSEHHPIGLHVVFNAVAEHTVEGAFPCGKSFEGYRNVIHGGVVSSLLDGAMANCIFAKGVEAYTVDMRIRFRGPVEVGIPAIVKGEWLRQEGPLHLLQASVSQNGKIKASARAKFFEGTPGLESQPMPGSANGLIKEGRKRPR